MTFKRSLLRCRVTTAAVPSNNRPTMTASSAAAPSGSQTGATAPSIGISASSDTRICPSNGSFGIVDDVLVGTPPAAAVDGAGVALSGGCCLKRCFALVVLLSYTFHNTVPLVSPRPLLNAEWIHRQRARTRPDINTAAEGRARVCVAARARRRDQTPPCTGRHVMTARAQQPLSQTSLACALYTRCDQGREKESLRPDISLTGSL